MNIWLVTIGEPVPTGEGLRDRPHRTGYFASFLARRGHDVVWWTSAFDHFRKKHWFDADHDLAPAERLRIRLLRGCGYRSNLSLARIRDQREIARKFARMAREEARAPQIIVAALPTIELCAESVKYGRERGVPVVLDMRDMWPDIFADAVPGPARPLARLLLWPMFRAARAACARATAITGITDEFVDWGLKRGRRQRSDLDRAFAMGYSVTPPSAEDVAAAEKFWDQQGVPAAGDGPIACFFGTLGRQFDMQTVLEAARLLQSQGGRVRFVLCGAGDRLDEFRTLASDLRNVYFPGWVDKAAIHVLMRRSMAGLDPLTDRYDFLATINNKAIEYLSAGLPIISSPGRGALNRLLSDERCGLSYEIGDAAGLVGVLSRLDREPELHASLADNARRVFLERFTADQVYGSMMEYLHEVVAGAKGRA